MRSTKKAVSRRAASTSNAVPLTKVSVAIIPGLVTAAVLFGGWGITKFVQSARAPAPTPTPSPMATAAPFAVSLPSPGFPLPVLRADTDSDGLPDDLERIYRTDPQVADTDNDGYPDGLEVTNGYDPTKPSPGDKLTVVSPAPASAGATAGVPLTYTEQFLSRTGLPRDPQSLLKSEELGGFIAETNARGFLPDVPTSELKVTGAAGKTAVARYLDAVSIPQNKRIAPVSAEEISAAFTTLTSTKDDKLLKNLLEKLATNVAELKKAPVPGEALALHQQYVAASLSLKDNAEKFLAYQTDYVGALVAASRIDTLRGVFRAVADGVKELEKKYGIS